MTDSLFASPVQGRESDERYTPRWVFDGLGVTFDLDPASPVEGGDCVPARRKLTTDDDGLAADWEGLVWLNPPFSNATEWARRFIAHGDGVFLGPIANARWTHDLMSCADLLWLCRDFPFTHPTHGGKRSSMPLMFASLGRVATKALERLARADVHPGVLMLRAPVAEVPRRLQLKRGGDKLPPNAALVCRPSALGNPFVIGAPHPLHRQPMTRADVVELHAELTQRLVDDPRQVPGGEFRAALERVRGKHLACRCELDEACHADTLLVLANR